MSKRKSKNFQMPKKTDMWQKDLMQLVDKQVNMEHRLGKQINYYKNATILNVDLRTGNRFRIEEKNGKKRWLIGGTYDILEIEEPKKDNCPELIDYGEKAKING